MVEGGAKSFLGDCAIRHQLLQSKCESDEIVSLYYSGGVVPIFVKYIYAAAKDDSIIVVDGIDADGTRYVVTARVETMQLTMSVQKIEEALVKEPIGFRAP